jgi:hypothetical protein
VSTFQMMPFLMLNLGTEMLYILDLRLREQKNSQMSDPKIRIQMLKEIINKLYEPKFMTEIFRPQKIYSFESVHKVFFKIANNSSNLRLNADSVAKLFDLMFMGLKY